MASLAGYSTNARLPEPLWMDLSDFAYSNIQTPGVDIQAIDNVLDGQVENTDVRFELEANGSGGLCTVAASCVGGSVDGITLTQLPNNTNAIKIHSNAMHQYAIELTGLGAHETINIFGVSEIATYQANGLPSATAYSGNEYCVGCDTVVATYGSLTGIGVTDVVDGTILITEPATDIIIQYATAAVATGEQEIDLQIGRLELGVVAPGTDVVTAIDVNGNGGISHRLSNQGVTVDVESQFAYTSGYYNGAYRVTRMERSASNPSDWNWLTTDTNDELISDSAHLGAIDHYRRSEHIDDGASDGHDDSLWIGRFSATPSILKIDLDNGQPDSTTTYQIVTLPTGVKEVGAIDATVFDGTHLWVSAYLGFADGNLNHYSIIRYPIPAPDPNISTVNLTGGEILAQLPTGLGEDLAAPSGLLAEKQSLYSQGLKVRPGEDGMPTRLYAIMSNVWKCQHSEDKITGENTQWCETSPNTKNEPKAFSGIYEFDVSGDITTVRAPTRIWYIEQDNGNATDPQSQHLEGFDFVPGHPDQIYVADAKGELLNRFELVDFFADNDVNQDGQVNLTDLVFVTDAINSGNSPTGFDFDDNGTFDSKDIEYFALNWLSATYGDVNLDGAIDSSDLGILLNNFNGVTDEGWNGGDLNGDGMVNSSDLGLLLNKFGSVANLDSFLAQIYV